MTTNRHGDTGHTTERTLTGGDRDAHSTHSVGVQRESGREVSVNTSHYSASSPVCYG